MAFTSTYIRAFNRVQRWIYSHPRLCITVVLLVLSVALLLSPIHVEREVLAPQNDTDRTFFGGEGIVAQEFLAERGLSQIRITFGPPGEDAGPFILHIRSTLQSEDLRVVPQFGVISPEVIFTFDPLWIPPTEKLMWILEAPHVPEKYFWVFREHDTSAFPEGRAFMQDRQVRGNFGFTIVRTLPRGILYWENFKLFIRDNSSSLFELLSVVVGLLVAVVYIFFGKRLKGRWNWTEKQWLLAIAICSAILHVVVATTIPAINDEGAYIQDIMQIPNGILPFRDILTKGPLFLLILFVWQFLIPNILLAWRMLSLVSSVGSIVALWFLTKELGFSRSARLWSAGLMGLLPGAVALTSPLLLQVVLIPISLMALLVVIRAAKSSSIYLLILAALLMNAAYFTRVSGAIVGVVGALAILLFSKRRWRDVGIYIGSGLLIFIVVLLIAYLILGFEKTAVMFNFEAVLVSAQRNSISEAPEATGEPLVRQTVILSRFIWQTAPLLMSSIFVWMSLWLTRQKMMRSVLWLIAATILAAQVYLTLADTGYLLPFHSLIISNTIVGLVLGTPMVLAVFQILYAKPWMPRREELLRTGLILTWLLLLGAAYGQWGRFRQSYLAEFIPPLVIFFVMAYQQLFVSFRGMRLTSDRWPRWVMGVAVGLMAASVWQGYFIALTRPFTGTISRHDLRAISTLVDDNVPNGATLFTAQPVMSVFAERPIMFGYAHPGWYREERLGYIPRELLDIFFQDPARITDYLRNEAQYVLVDDRTVEIYFDGYPERSEILAKDFVAVGNVGNEGTENLVVLYKRR